MQIPSANTESTSPHAASLREELAAHLFSLELALHDPAVRHDRARVESLLTEDFQEFGSSGLIWSRSQILDLLESEPARQIAALELACHSIAEGVALLTYRAVTTDPLIGASLTTLRSSLWVCANGQWRMRFHQGTRTG